jgi:F-type H+-transporting ATPase subunit a
MGNITRKGLSKLFSLSFLVITLMIAGAKPAVAAEGEGSKTDFIMHHIQDSHEWHLMTLHAGQPDEHHVTIPLPIVIYNKTEGSLDVFMSSAFYNEEHKRAPYNGYELDSHDHLSAVDGDEIMDLSITKNVASMLLSVVILFAIFLPVAKSYKKNANAAPKGMQSFFEPLITFVRDDIAKPNIGHKYEKFMPYLLSVFFFIFLNNLLGLLPGGANVTGNIAITFVLAVFTLIITNINGTKHYWGHILWMPGVPLPLKPLMAVIEIVGIFTKPFALMVRLFANITAGHIIILSIIGLIFILGSSFVGVASVPFAIAMNFLELLVAFIQAYVFTLLSAIFIGQAAEEHH